MGWGWQGSLRFVTGTEVWFLKDERRMEHLWLVMMRVVVCVGLFDDRFVTSFH